MEWNNKLLTFDWIMLIIVASIGAYEIQLGQTIWSYMMIYCAGLMSASILMRIIYD